jgi:hypothetical protein
MSQRKTLSKVPLTPQFTTNGLSYTDVVFQLGHRYYCLTVTGHVLPTTSSNEYAKWPTLDFTIHDDMSCLLTLLIVLSLVDGKLPSILTKMRIKQVK